MGQGVIKYFLFLFLIQNLSSQIKLKGTYCKKTTREFDKCLTFNENKFIYEEKGPYGQQNYGEGVYKLYNNKLFLNFNLTKIKNISYHKVIEEKKSNNNNNSHLIFNIKDSEGNLPNTIVTLNKILKKESNFLGNVSFVVPKSNCNIKIKFSRLGSDNYSFVLVPNKDYKINIYLNQFSGTPIINVKKEINIKILGNNSFREYRKEDGKIIWNKHKP